MSGHKPTIFDRVRSCSLPLLIFLCGMVHVKLYIKLAAVIFYAAYLLYRRAEFSRKLSSPSWFYLLLIPLGACSALCNGVDGNPDYWRGFALGATKWVTAAAGFYLLSLTVQRVEQARLTATIKVFFLLNACVSLGELVSVMIESHRWMPYWINDSTKFGISTGDYIRGLTRDSSIANAALSLAGILFFLYRKNLKWMLLCVLILVMCTSNFSLLLLFVCMAAVLILIRDRRIKLYALGCSLCTILLYGFLSMQNVSYANKTIKQEISGMTSGPKNEHISMQQDAEDGDVSSDATAISTRMISAAGVVRDLQRMNGIIRRQVPPVPDTGLARQAIRDWYGVSYDSSRLALSGTPGKLYALLQTGSYMISSPRRFLLGAGPGNFSSNLAIKMTGLGLYGSYAPGHIYVHPDFLGHHLYIWMYVYAHTREFHSVVQMPASVYSQIGGEYGLAGMVLFGVLYLGFFLRRSRYRPSAFIITAMLMGYFFVDYWFEMISLTVVFELLMLMEWSTPPASASDKT